MVVFAGVVALIAIGYTVVSGQQRLAAIRAREYIYIVIGLILVMLVAQVIYFFGVQATSLTTLAYTMLAFPIISLIAELILGRVKLSLSRSWAALHSYAHISAISIAARVHSCSRSGWSLSVCSSRHTI